MSKSLRFLPFSFLIATAVLLQISDAQIRVCNRCTSSQDCQTPTVCDLDTGRCAFNVRAGSRCGYRRRLCVKCPAGSTCESRRCVATEEASSPSPAAQIDSSPSKTPSPSSSLSSPKPEETPDPTPSSSAEASSIPSPSETPPSEKESPSPIAPTPEEKVSPTPTPNSKSGTASTSVTCGGPFVGEKIGKYAQQVDDWLKENSGPNADKIQEKIAGRATAVWLGDWIEDIGAKASEIRDETIEQSAKYTIVLYNIPNRDCGQFSAGGVDGSAVYKSWIDELAGGLKGAMGVVILEPDALTLTDCLSDDLKKERFELLTYAVTTLKSVGAIVHIDAGHARWLSVDVVSERLQEAGVEEADGFAINTSNSVDTEESVEYGDKIVEMIGGGKGYIIDVSRNGAGPPAGLGPNGGQETWCNVPTIRLGQEPTFDGSEFSCNVHGLLWVKTPGESDGECSGGPPAGEFWETGALRLAGVDV